MSFCRAEIAREHCCCGSVDVRNIDLETYNLEDGSRRFAQGVAAGPIHERRRGRQPSVFEQENSRGVEARDGQRVANAAQARTPCLAYAWPKLVQSQREDMRRCRRHERNTHGGALFKTQHLQFTGGGIRKCVCVLRVCCCCCLCQPAF